MPALACVARNMTLLRGQSLRLTSLSTPSYFEFTWLFEAPTSAHRSKDKTAIFISNDKVPVFENDRNQSPRVRFPFKPFCTQLFPCAETKGSPRRKRECHRRNDRFLDYRNFV